MKVTPKDRERIITLLVSLAANREAFLEMNICVTPYIRYNDCRAYHVQNSDLLGCYAEHILELIEPKGKSNDGR